MALKGNIDVNERGFYFALNGDDDFDGSTLERPKRTIQAAIDAAFALVPIPSTVNTAQVTVGQGAAFNESFVLEDSIQFNGRDVSLRTTTLIGVDLGSALACEVTTVTNTTTNGICFNIDNKTRVGLNCSFIGVFGTGSSTGIKLDRTRRARLSNLAVDLLAKEQRDHAGFPVEHSRKSLGSGCRWGVGADRSGVGRQRRSPPRIPGAGPTCGEQDPVHVGRSPHRAQSISQDGQRRTGAGDLHRNRMGAGRRSRIAG